MNSVLCGSGPTGGRGGSFARTPLALVPLLVALVAGCAARRPAPVTTPGEPAAPPRAAGVQHTVEPGQTLWRIARVYGLPLDDLSRANGIDDPTSLEIGQRLFVPGATRLLHVPPHPEPLPGSPPAPVLAPPQRADVAGWPVEGGHILSPFGAQRNARRHAGLDIGGSPGQPVRAVWGGRVIYTGSTMRGYGKTVILDHGEGLSSLYAHNSDLLVDEGSWVEPGQAIARIGRTGNASAVHCHFEVRRGDVPVDPLPYLATAQAERR